MGIGLATAVLYGPEAAKLRPLDKLVLTALAEQGRDATGISWPGRPMLAAAGNCSEASVPGVLRRLTEAGLIEKRAGTGYRGRRAEYIVKLGKGLLSSATLSDAGPSLPAGSDGPVDASTGPLPDAGKGLLADGKGLLGDEKGLLGSATPPLREPPLSNPSLKGQEMTVGQPGGQTADEDQTSKEREDKQDQERYEKWLRIVGSAARAELDIEPSREVCSYLLRTLHRSRTRYIRDLRKYARQAFADDPPKWRTLAVACSDSNGHVPSGDYGSFEDYATDVLSTRGPRARGGNYDQWGAEDGHLDFTDPDWAGDGTGDWRGRQRQEDPQRMNVWAAVPGKRPCGCILGLVSCREHGQ